MQWSLTRLLQALILLSLLSLASCVQQAKRSELFDKIFLPDKGGLIRGVELGMSLEQIKEIEGAPPKHDDRWGYVYELNLGEQGRFFLEYISKKAENRVANSIVVNVFLDDEGVTSELYGEMEAALRSRYGVAEGGSTSVEWQDKEEDLFITLRVLDDKKSISLNFVAIGGF